MFVTCASCEQKIYRQDDQLICKNCSSTFHLRCSNVNIDDFMNMSRNGTSTKWKCCECADSNIRPPLNVSFHKETGDGILNSKEEATTGHSSSSDSVNKSTGGGDILEMTDMRQVSESSIEIFYLKEIINQKEHIINSQTDLINSLKEQIIYLKNSLFTDERAPSAGKIDNRDNSRVLCDVEVLSCENGGLQIDGARELSALPYHVTVVDPKNCDSHATAATLAGSPPQQTRIPSTVAPTEGATCSSPPKEKRGRFRKPIMGNRIINEGGTHILRAAKMMRSYVITKLDPHTTDKDVKECLLALVPDVRVEKLNAKYPDAYSSFKVTVCEDDEKSILDPSIWPAGSKVYRFFHARKKKL